MERSSPPQLKLKNRIESIPGGFRWTVPETGAEIGPETNMGDLLSSVRAHYRANDMLPPNDIEDRLEHDNCLRAPPERCRPAKHSEGGEGWVARAKQELGTVISGTMTLGQWLIQHGGETVSGEEAAHRASICVQCPYNVQPSGCKPCNSNKVENTIQKAIGHRSTQHDRHLKSCAICGCHLRAKVWIPAGVLQTKQERRRLNQYPSWCWIAQELKGEANDHSESRNGVSGGSEGG